MAYLLYIAEDDAQFARYLEKVAAKSGWFVTLCSDGLELVARLELETSAALVLIDVQMPHMDGIEVIDALLDVKHRLRLRFMSGGPLADTLAARMIANGREMLVGQTIHKPITLNKLLDIFENEKMELDKMSYIEKN